MKKRKELSGRCLRMRSALVAGVTLLSCLLPLTNASSQTIQLGVKGGVDVTEMDFNNEVLKSSNRAGFFIGPVLNIKMPIAFLSVDVAALYDQCKLRVDDETVTQKTIQVPAHARLGVDLGDMAGVFLCAGPQFNFNVGSTTFDWGDISGSRKNFKLKDTTLGLNLGGGVKLGSHLEAAVYYTVPLGNTADFTWDTLVDGLEEQTMHRARSKKYAWRVSLAYYF